MKSKTLILLILLVAMFTQTAFAVCSLDIKCGAGTPQTAYRKQCIVSADCSDCDRSNARLCFTQQGTCLGQNVIWEKWSCDLNECPCYFGGAGDGEW